MPWRRIDGLSVRNIGKPEVAFVFVVAINVYNFCLRWNGRILDVVILYKKFHQIFQPWTLERFFFFSDLGIDNSSIIPSSSFTASSWECMSPAEFAKSNPSSRCHAAWCGQGLFTFLQLKLDAAYFVAQIRTKGCSRGHFVASFYLEHSLDGITWENYTQGGVRQVKIFVMNGFDVSFVCMLLLLLLMFCLFIFPFVSLLY